MAQFTYATRQSQPAKKMAAILTTHLRARLLIAIFTTFLLRQPVHFKITLRSNPEGIRHSIEEREHGRDINSLGYLRLRPPMTPQFLHVLICGAICRFRHPGYIIEQSTFRGAQACFFQIAIRNGLYRFVFCSLNTQEVCMRIQSIGAAIEPGYPTRDGFLGSAVKMTF